MKIKSKIRHYTYRVVWSEEDAEFVGLCAEFPSLSYLSSTPEKALGGILHVVNDVVEDMKKNNERIPEPLMYQRYSGKFVVRVPPEVHRELAIEAAEENVSLNRLVNARLCSHLGQ
jgi:predicted HicB family RNase H-like nuclease